MFSTNFYTAVLALSVLLSQANGQTFTKCIRTCIDNSQYSDCKVTDFTGLSCLCRAGRTSGSFLPDVVNCMHKSCIDISVDVLLFPLENFCNLAGASLPQSAIDAAKSEASSLATETQTQTQTQTETATTTATTEFTRVVQTTVTQTEKGTTNTVVIPVTIERTKTVSGEPSTVTKSAPASSVTKSNSNSNSNSGSSAALASTLSSMISSIRSSSSLTTSSEESTTTILTSTTVLGEAVTSTIENTQSTNTAPRPATETNSAPFMNTNTAGKVTTEGSWLGLGIMLLMGVIWF